MPRRLRIHLPGGFYHATLRGNHREAIFRAASDRALLNAIVARALKLHSARLHAYCWMTNHLHFFIQVGEVPLGVVMRHIASNYARAYQAKIETTGHLFERRYFAKVVDVEAYLFAVLRYIHLNPVADGLVKRVADYPWSSHRAYAGVGPPCDWLETNFILSAFARSKSAAHRAYQRFMRQEIDDTGLALPEAGTGDVLGDDDFIARVLNRPSTERVARQSLQELVTEACKKFVVTEERLVSASRDLEVVRARAWIALRARQQGSASLSEVARILGRDRATLRYAIRRHAPALE